MASSPEHQQQPKRQPGGASGLYRAPTWARNIDFGNSFDLGISQGPSVASADVSSSPTMSQTWMPSSPTAISNSSGPRRAPVVGDGYASGPPSASSSPKASFSPRMAPQPSHNGPSAAPLHSRQKSWQRLGTPDGSSGAIPTADSTPRAPAAGAFSMTPNAAGPSHSRTASGHYSGSSADLYAQPVPPPAQHDLPINAHVQGGFGRPPSSLSVESGRLPNFGGAGAAGGQEGSRDTHATGESSANKRASILSFQTALSGYDRSVDGGMNGGGAVTPTSAPRPRPGIEADDGGMELLYSNGSQAATSSDLNLPGGWAGPSGAGRRMSPGLRKLDLAAETPRRGSTTSPPTSAKQSPVASKMLLSTEPEGDAEQAGLERQRTLKPTHGRQASLQESKNQLPALPPSARSASNPLPAIPPPMVPDKEPPPSLPAKEYPSPPAKMSVTLPPASSSPPLSNDVIPPPLPSSVAPSASPVVAPMNISSPVSDFRKKPLVNVTPEMQAAGVASLQEQKGLAGLGAHNGAQRREAGDAGKEDGEDQVEASARPRANSSAGLLPRAALVSAPQAAEPVGRSSISDSIETPSREPSPPPEGEIEARAEWERAMMKRKQKSETGGGGGGARKTTLRGQLKPLQLVPNEGSRPPQPPSPYDAPARANGGGGGGAGMTTQQLQRQQARDQRRSVGAINMMAMAGGNDFAVGSNGPYPVFPSPSTAATPGGPTAATGRVYAGMVPQRSLVPPFELQQRPDGLLSGLIGPDGVRRSVNDPEVCLECMMRDEDMIDVHVVGPGLWERESDRDFDEALRTEAEDDAMRVAERSSATGEEQNSLAGHSSSQHASSINKPRTKIRVKRVGQHDPLTADRLKLHTQMNPPASSHRWRTLQNFLAVQAKYIAMEQRARQEEWERAHPVEARRAAAAAMARTGSSDGAPVSGDSLVNRKSISRNRSASALLSGSRGTQIINDDDLPAEERMLKERDVASAREARRKNVSGDAPLKYNKQMPVPPLPHQLTVQTDSLDDPQHRRFSSSPGNVTPRRPMPSSRGGPGPSRGASASDLRGVPGSMLTSPTMPSTPDGLAPPTPLQMSTPRGFGGRTASQLSLAPSGSMLDMHVAMGGPASSNMGAGGHATPNMPFPSPMELERSGSSSPRNFFGFPGDGEASRQSFQQDDAGRADVSGERSDASAAGKKKKGLRGLFSKISGNASGSNPSMNNLFHAGLADKRSDGSASPVATSARRGSLSADSTLAPPPGIGGLMSRARRSTSSLLGGRDSVEQVRDLYAEPPSSPDRFDMGPFQPPLPPERKQSKLVPEENRGLAPMRTSSSTSSYSPQVGQRPPQSPTNGSHSPTNSRTTSMASMQSRILPPQHQQQKGKLPTIDASPGTEPQALDGRGSRRLDQASARSSRTTDTYAEIGPLKQRPESRTSVADSRRSRLSVASKPPFDSLPVRNSSAPVDVPGRPSLNLPPSRPTRSPRRQDTNASASSHSTAATANQRQQPVYDQQQWQQQQQRFSSIPGGGQASYMQPMSVGMPSRNFSGGLGPEIRQELAAGQPAQQPQYSPPDEGATATRRGSAGRDRKSKLLKLPFGFGNKNKNRSSSLLQPVQHQQGGPIEGLPWSPATSPQSRGFSEGLYAEGSEQLNSAGPQLRAFSAPFETQSLRSRASIAALNVNTSSFDEYEEQDQQQQQQQRRPRKSMNLFERPRAFSSFGTRDADQLPPRSASALGTLPLASFVRGKKGRD